LVLPLASNIFAGKGCWSIFIGFWVLELPNLILLDSIADYNCCLNTLHSFVLCEVVLCHLQYNIFFNSSADGITWLGDSLIWPSWSKRSNILSTLVISKVNFSGSF
jgi:hypothetical protein